MTEEGKSQAGANQIPIEDVSFMASGVGNMFSKIIYPYSSFGITFYFLEGMRSLQVPLQSWVPLLPPPPCGFLVIYLD